MITPGHPDGDGRRSKDLADIIKALKRLPLPPVPPRIRYVTIAPPVVPAVALEPATAMRGYVLAWRQWGTVFNPDETFRLMSFHGGAIWPPRARLVAACLGSQLPSPHLPPEPLCSCGIYALKNGAAFQPQFWSTRPVQRKSNEGRRYRGGSRDGELISWTLGKVALWGRVLEGTDGFRGQYGYPNVLWSTDLTKDERVALGAAYGVEVNQLDSKALKAIGNSGYEFVE